MAAASPSKRPRSPEHAIAAFASAPPAKLTHSPSTRDSAAFAANITGATASATAGGPAVSAASNSMAAMMQQADYDGNHYPAAPASSSKIYHHPRSTNASAAGGRIFSDSPVSTHAPQPPVPSSSSSNYRIASHSGSTTSGFSGGSVGSSYDGSSIAGGSYAMYNDADPGSAVPSSAGSAHGLGVHVQGPGYGTYSSSSRPQQHPSPAHHHAPQPHQSSSGHQYYTQPYGYQATGGPPSHLSHYSSSSTASPLYHPSSAGHAQQVYPASVGHHVAAGPGGPYPPSLSQHHRRSIAGQSAGGSSYHSGASASPTGHRRSDDMMDGTFTSGALLAGSAGGPPSNPYSTPITEAAHSPAPHKAPTQGWLLTGPSSAPGSAHMAHASVPSPTASGYADPSKPITSAESPSHPSNYASAQNYQAIVDEIMNQTRKGTDYGLDLGDFEMLDTLGTGTFGRVLLVRLHTRASSVAGLSSGMPHYFAMKVLSKTEVVRLKQVEHISCERSILGAVDHPGIVNLFCTFQDSLNIYMLLEFVQGGELFSHLRRAVRFSADVTRFYAANIILVLEYLHNRNLIYRDLKPENLLLDSHGYLKVTDFGFAKYVPDRTFTLCGTPEYLAPEIINSAGHGKAADWWAFGVLLFEMLCGYPPFFDESPWGIYEKILAGNFSFPPHVDPVARDLIRRLLSSDRSKRLGNLRGGASDVKNHQWFEGVDWTSVERRSIPAPIVPRIKSTSDSQNFERYPAIPLETLPGLARAKGIQVNEEPDPYEHMFLNF